MSIRFRGLFPIIHTPFTANGDVDFDSLRSLIAYIEGKEVDGMVFPAFASEFWRLSDAEIFESTECIAKAKQSKALLILNVTAQASVPATASVREFSKIGAAAIMTLPPFLVPVSPAAVEQHLDLVLRSTTLPCLIQDSAGLTGTKLDPQVLVRLKKQHPHFSALKVDQVPTGPSITAYRSTSGLEKLSYLVGYSGVQMFDSARRGAEGLMGGCGHLSEDRTMLNALFENRSDGYKAFARLAPLLNFEMQSLDMVIGVHKQLLYEAGVFSTPLCRMPCGALDAVHLDEMKVHLRALGYSDGA